MIRRALTLGLAALVVALPQELAAQGRGRPKRPQSTVATTSTPAPGSTTAASNGAAGPSFPAFRQFGSWLDDTGVAAGGEGATGIGIGYWRATGGSQIDVPILDVTYGLTSRVQLAATVPFYRASYQGATARGVDDVYLSGKVAAIDPAAGTGRTGLAISPVVEILSAGSVDGRRVHWALPVSVEFRSGATRVYGSTGYFSRGAVFAGGAVEWTAPVGSVVTGALTQSYSTTSDVAGGSAGTSRQRVDATLAVAQPVTDAMAAYVTIGRSLTSIAEGGTSLALSGGVSVRFARSVAP